MTRPVKKLGANNAPDSKQTARTLLAGVSVAAALGASAPAAGQQQEHPHAAAKSLTSSHTVSDSASVVAGTIDISGFEPVPQEAGLRFRDAGVAFEVAAPRDGVSALDNLARNSRSGDAVFDPLAGNAYVSVYEEGHMRLSLGVDGRMEEDMVGLNFSISPGRN